MSRFNTIVLLLSVICLVKGNTLQREVVSFIEHELVPDILSVPPAEILSVRFSNGEQALEGNQLMPSEVTGVPTLEWNYQTHKYYTLVMCDADAPSRLAPEGRSFLHWHVVNIPGEDVTAGQTLTNILNSRPEPLTGFHRYVFLIYEQPAFIDFEEGPSDEFERRVNFMPEDFANKYNMGAPVAGNFYQTENFEDLVETIGMIKNVTVLR